MQLGNEAAKFVSAAFPNPMELKFERVAQPFMLLHVNRCSADMPALSLSSMHMCGALASEASSCRHAAGQEKALLCTKWWSAPFPHFTVHV